MAQFSNVNRFLIVGGPGCGKTYMSRAYESTHRVLHTDDTLDMEWSQASFEVSTWFDISGSLVIEGVTVPRALRKWRERNPHKSVPFDKVIVLSQRRTEAGPPNKGQSTMAKGIETVLSELYPWLKNHLIYL